MSNLHLVTGYAGKAHVSAADHGSFVEAVIRSGQFVTNAGSKFAAAVISNNQIRISDGELIMQGRHVKLDPGAYIDVTVENGTQGYCRNDLIVARYQKNADSSIETVDFVTIKGSPVESNPSDPAYVTGDINGGNALQNDMPMYRVPLNGLNVGDLVPLFTPQDALFDMILRRDGSVPMGGDLSMGGKRVKDVAEPEADGDAVNLGYANENFAPAGYGLGKVAYDMPVSADANECLSNGWCRIDSTTANGIGAPAVMRVDAYSSSHVVQTACSGNYSGAYFAILRRENHDGVWGPWAWPDPPMVPGVEYRTTERWNGLSVYAKAFDFGALPNNTTKSITYNPGSAAYTPITGGLITSNGQLIVGTGYDDYMSTKTPITVTVGAYSVKVKIDDDFSTASATAWVKYVKN